MWAETGRLYCILLRSVNLEDLYLKMYGFRRESMTGSRRGPSLNRMVEIPIVFSRRQLKHCLLEDRDFSSNKFLQGFCERSRFSSQKIFQVAAFYLQGSFCDRVVKRSIETGCSFVHSCSKESGFPFLN